MTEPALPSKEVADTVFVSQPLTFPFEARTYPSQGEGHALKMLPIAQEDCDEVLLCEVYASIWHDFRQLKWPFEKFMKVSGFHKSRKIAQLYLTSPNAVTNSAEMCHIWAHLTSGNPWHDSPTRNFFGTCNIAVPASDHQWFHLISASIREEHQKLQKAINELLRTLHQSMVSPGYRDLNLFALQGQEDISNTMITINPIVDNRRFAFIAIGMVTKLRLKSQKLGQLVLFKTRHNLQYKCRTQVELTLHLGEQSTKIQAYVVCDNAIAPFDLEASVTTLRELFRDEHADAAIPVFPLRNILYAESSTYSMTRDWAMSLHSAAPDNGG